MKTLYIAILLILSVTLGTFCAAETAERPKIGLVLSGGGARGFAHIGVLRWLEENRIPVDYVAGTSMGGLIGGMYAVGMSPDELHAVTSDIDWTDLFRPVPRFDTLNFRRKEDRRAYPNHLELGLKGGLTFPPGLNSGHSIGLLLNRLTLAYSTVPSFDDLPIPFRCVATDMVEAKQVVLHDGSLAEAMRATMSIPGIFAPVEINGKLLASDGGLLNNVPTDVMEQMGADIIIAVDIGTPLGKREDLDSLSGMLGQTIGVVTIENVRRNLDQSLHPKLKVIVTPELEGYETLDFPESEKIIELGYKGAGQKAGDLSAYALSPDEWEKHLAARKARKKETLPVPKFVEVSAASERSTTVVMKETTQFTGKEISTDVLEAELNRIWGRGKYATLNYELTEQDGEPGLLIRAREKSYAPPFLNLGIELNNTETDVFDFNLRGRVTLMDAVQNGSEWRFEGSLGSRILIGAEYYKLMRGSHFFVAPRGVISRTKTGIFVDERQVAQYEVRSQTLGIDLGAEIGSNSELRLGYEFGHLDGELRIGDPVLPEVSGKVSYAILRWEYDGVNSPVLPTHGIRSSARFRYVLDTASVEGSPADQEFPQLQGRVTSFSRLGKKGTLLLGGEGGTSFDKSVPAIEKFTLGGLFRMGALSADELRGDHYLYGAAGYIHKIANMPPLIGEKISAIAFYEFGAAYDEWDNKDVLNGMTLGVVAELFLGPVFVGGSFGEGGRSNFYFAIGRFF